MVVRNVAVVAAGLCVAAFVAAVGAESANRHAPTTPGRLVVTHSGQTSITVSWDASTDNIAVAGYSLYVDESARFVLSDSMRVHTTEELSYTFEGLRCGATYGLAVDAFDRAANRSDPATVLASTAKCDASSPPAPVEPVPTPTRPAPAAPAPAPSSPSTSTPTTDRNAPTVPGNLRVTRVTSGLMWLAWSRSTDNVAVAGYTTYVDGVAKASSRSLGSRVAGLACGRTYVVAVDAYDRAGNRSGRSALAAATTPCPDATPPTIPSGFRQAFTTGDAVVLTWSPSTDATGVVSYGVYTGRLRVGSSAESTYTFTGLTCGKSYSIGVDAVDAAGNRSAQGSVVVAAAACADSVAPTQPSGLAVTTRTASAITVVWDASADNVGVSEYGLYVDGAKKGATTGTSTTFSGLACGTTFSLGIDAADAGGNRSPVSRVSAATAGCAPPVDAQAPTTPTSIAATAATQTGLAVAWAPSTDNVGVAGYVAYRDGIEVGRPSTASHNLSGLACGRSYRIGVEAFDAAGNRSPRGEATLWTAACSDTAPPTQPSGVQTASRTTTSISITWVASTDNAGVAGYGVYRGGVQVAESTQLGYTISGLACGTNHTIGVDAFDAAGNRSGVASVMIATAPCPDTLPPSTPTGLAASNVTQTSAQLSWTASTDAAGVVGYGVYRGGTLVGQPASPEFALADLACGSSYAVGVDAVDAAGNRSAQASLVIATAACPPASTARVFVSPLGNDANACTQAQPCRSFQRGYEKAVPGDVVELAAGDYGAQSMRRDAAKTSATDVVFRPAPGAVVKVRGLFLGLRETPGSGPEHLTIENVSDSRSPQGAFDLVGANDVTWINLDAANFYIDRSSNVTIRGGDWGPCTVPSQTCSNSKIDVDSGQNILVENATFHDYRIVPNSGEHFECMIIFGGQNITVRNSSFRDCEFYNIFVQHPAWAGYAGPDGTWPRDMVFERNIFTPVWENGVFGRRFSALAFSPRQRPFYNVSVRCNDFTGGAYTSVNDDGDGTQYVNFTITPLTDSSC